MIALLRSDAYHVLRSRWFWAFVVAMAILTFAPALLMRWTSMGPTSFDRLIGSGVSLGGVEILSACMAAAVGTGAGGFDRTVLSALGRRARTVWYAEKCVFVALLSLAAVTYALALGLLALPVSGAPVLSVEPAWQVAVWLGCMWLCCAVYAILTMAVGLLTRSQTVTIGFALLASTGILEGGALLGIDMLAFLAGGEFLSVSSVASPWVPAGVVSALASGAPEALSLQNSTGVAPALRALVVCVPVVLATTAASALALSRRDVA